MWKMNRNTRPIKISKLTQFSVHKILCLQILEKENSFKKCEIIKPDWQQSKCRRPNGLNKKGRKNKIKFTLFSQ
jgi:hypothetical protein